MALAGNLLSVNAESMETDASAWQIEGTNTTLTWDTAHALDGTHAIKLVNTAGADYAKMHLVTNVASLTPGKLYGMYASIYSLQVNCFYEIQIDWYNGITFLSSLFLPTTPPLGSAAFEKTVFMSGRAPTNTTAADVKVQCFPAAAGNSFWIDSVFFGENINTPQVNKGQAVGRASLI